MFNFLGKIFGTSNDRKLKKMQKSVDQISQLEAEFSDQDALFFQSYKESLFKKYSDNEDIFSILPEAFAAVREAGKRTIKLRHFDSQLLGGIALADVSNVYDPNERN